MRLSAQFQAAFQEDPPAVPLVEALASRLAPGVHITLLRSPVLEDALARHQPGTPLYVLQPSRSGDRSVLTSAAREGAGLDEAQEAPRVVRCAAGDPGAARLYRGYLPNRALGPPLLTEDDFLQGVRDLEALLPRGARDGDAGSPGAPARAAAGNVAAVVGSPAPAPQPLQPSAAAGREHGDVRAGRLGGGCVAAGPGPARRPGRAAAAGGVRGAGRAPRGVGRREVPHERQSFLGPSPTARRTGTGSSAERKSPSGWRTTCWCTRASRCSGTRARVSPR